MDLAGQENKSLPPTLPGQDRRRHAKEIQAFLQEHISSQSWKLTIPGGSGGETYFAHSQRQTCFVKLGAQSARYQALAAIGLTPQVLAAGFLEDGTSVIIQPRITGRCPERKDYHTHLDQFAAAIKQVHHSVELKRILPRAASDLYRVAGIVALDQLQEKWRRYKDLVPMVSGFIDESLADIGQQVRLFEGAGLAASHNDICNANWLITPSGQLYLIDLESMSMEDPAVDIGATLWWYYPPELRHRFLIMAEHANDAAFEKRMYIRMAMHCLNITLPRQQSYDQFDPDSFDEDLADFRAIMAGRENPQGYNT